MRPRRLAGALLAAADVIAFVIEAIQKTVSGLISAPSGRARLPKAL